MILFLLAYLGGVLTIVSPCILPVIPFVLARADRPFLRNGLPMLIGMSLAFAVVASLASVAGGWVVSANQYGRVAALVLLAVFGLTLLFPGVADRLMQPLVSVERGCRNPLREMKHCWRRWYWALRPDFYGRPALAPFSA
jgi:cytochrome c biogenesis protein CcdA